MINNSSRQNILAPLLFVIFSLVLIIADQQKTLNLNPIRTYISSTLYPIQVAIDLPYQLSFYLNSYFFDHNKIITDNKKLEKLALIYAARDQKYRSILEENKRLRMLLKADSMATEKFALAKILSVNTSRFHQTIIINKGSKDHLYEGQVVIAGNSIYGQVISTNYNSAVVMQLTDPKHTIPVRNSRTGTLALAVGTGQTNMLELIKTESTNDVHAGDLFVTSGLGQVFPADFPVAIVENATYNPSDSFTTIRAKTITEFNKNREVLLIWTSTMQSTSASDTSNNNNSSAYSETH